jgi:hypothetical protein
LPSTARPAQAQTASYSPSHGGPRELAAGESSALGEAVAE